MTGRCWLSFMTSSSTSVAGGGDMSVVGRKAGVMTGPSALSPAAVNLTWKITTSGFLTIYPISAVTQVILVGLFGPSYD